MPFATFERERIASRISIGEPADTFGPDEDMFEKLNGQFAVALFDERKALANEVAQLRREVAMGGKATGPESKEINGVKFIAQVLSGVSGKDLPSLIDEMKARIGSGAVLLIADTGAKPAVAAGVTADLTAKVSAVALVKAAAEAMGGKGGGGRPDMAQAGGADIALAEAAIAAAEAAIKG